MMYYRFVIYVFANVEDKDTHLCIVYILVLSSKITI